MLTAGAAVGAVLGWIVAGWLIGRRRRAGQVSAAWFKDRLQFGRDHHDG